MGTNNDSQLDKIEISKSEVHPLVQVAKYIPNTIVRKTILKKPTGNITALSVATGETVAEKTIPFDSFIQIIDGEAEAVINKKKYQLKAGYGIIIPAHATHFFNARKQFKMISTIIKSGYESHEIG